MFCWRRAIVRLVAFVWLFSAASFQMFPQITCLRIYKITLVAFVDTVCFQMCIRLVYFLERCCGGMVYFLERCCLGMVLFLERCRVVEGFSRNVRGCVILLKLLVWFGLLERRLVMVAFLERCKKTLTWLSHTMINKPVERVLEKNLSWWTAIASCVVRSPPSASPSSPPCPPASSPPYSGSGSGSGSAPSSPCWKNRENKPII